MGRVARSLGMFSLLIAVSVAVPGSGVATTTVSPQAAASPSSTIEIQWWMGAEEGQAIAIVSTSIDPEAELPAVVRLPIPPGMTVDWAGEIAGGDVSQDIERQFTVEDGANASFAEFTVSEHRSAQIDLSGKNLTDNGDSVSAKLDYVQSVPSSDTAFSVRLPPGASSVRIEPAPQGAPSKNAAGETLYTLPLATLEPGDSLTTIVEYTSGESGRLAGEGSGSALQPGQLIAVLVAAAVAVVVALVVVLRRQARVSSATPEDDENGQRPAAAALPVPPTGSSIDDSDGPFHLED